MPDARNKPLGSIFTLLILLVLGAPSAIAEEPTVALGEMQHQRWDQSPQIVVLELPADGEQLMLYLRDGRFSAGHVWHPDRQLVDLLDGEAALEGGNLSAQLRRLAYRDFRATPRGTYRIKARVAGERISGTCEYAGKDEDRGGGTIAGRLIAHEALAKTNVLAAGADWPRLRGPHGNGVGSAGEHELIDHWHQARVLWASEARPTVVKCDSGSPPPQSSYTSPIIGDGLIFLHSAEPNPAGGVDRGVKGYAKGLEVMGQEYADRIGAWLSDDVVWAMDAATGATVWRVRLPLTGCSMTPYDGKCKTGLFATPVYVNGRLYVGGLSRRLYCFDARTGELIWMTSTDPSFNQAFDAAKQTHAATPDAQFDVGAGPNRHCSLNEQVQSSPLVVDGVVVWSTGMKGAAIAFDANTGKHLWTAAINAHPSSPTVWSHAGQDYLLTNRGLYEPRTGRALWTFFEEQALEVGTGLCVVADLVFDMTAANGPRIHRITPKGAQLVWQFADGGADAEGAFSDMRKTTNHGEIKTFQMPQLTAATGGEGWFLVPGRKDGWFLVTGRGAEWKFTRGLQSSGGIGTSISVGDYLLPVGENRASPMVRVDAAKGALTAAGTPLGQLENPDMGDTHGLQASWSCATHAAYADGRLFLRTHEAILCLDLRRQR